MRRRDRRSAEIHLGSNRESQRCMWRRQVWQLGIGTYLVWAFQLRSKPGASYLYFVGFWSADCRRVRSRHFVVESDAPDALIEGESWVIGYCLTPRGSNLSWPAFRQANK